MNNLNIKFPLLESKSSENYGLMITDSNNVTFYWNHDGSYDGKSMPPEVDFNTHTNSN